MKVTVIVKHNPIDSWADASEIYSCSTGLGLDVDPVPVTAVVSQSPDSIKIGEWIQWEEFSKTAQFFQLPAEAQSDVDVLVDSFPRRKKMKSAIAIRQSILAEGFLRSVCSFIPRIRPNLKGVWICVE